MTLELDDNARLQSAIRTCLLGYSETLSLAGVSDFDICRAFVASACANAEESSDPELLELLAGLMRRNANLLENAALDKASDREAILQ